MNRSDPTDEPRDRLLEFMERVQERNRDVPIEEIEADVREAIREVREARYGRRNAERESER